ncbi:taste receptor type 2 member 104-like [Engystomops pustulosus]|uniref:taste receptor type 2 member 104-like n=1 Tax=Engystomops pustulosus TaxID=76066 RepID=UPI003AFB33A6
MNHGSIERFIGFLLNGVLVLLVVGGILLNVFIVTVNLNCWKKFRPLQSIDVIITGLAMVRVMLLFVYSLFIIDNMSDTKIKHLVIARKYLMPLSMSAEFCNLWWGSVLCVFYCAKITNYSNRLFIMIKRNISKMVHWLLLLSLALSVLSCLPSRWFVFYRKSLNGTDSTNVTIELNRLHFFLIRLAGSIIPFVILCFSIGLLILSLIGHTRRLASQGSGFRDVQRDVHLGVIRSMVSFLVLCVLYFLGSNLLPVSMILRKQLLTAFCFTTYVIFPSLHSVSFIISNKALKKAFLNALHWLGIRRRDLGT